MRLRTLVPLVGLLALTACKDEKKAEAPPATPPAPSAAPTPATPPAPASPTPSVTPPAEKPAGQ